VRFVALRPESDFELVVEGVDQIKRSSAATGIVIVSFKNKILHEALLDDFGRHAKTIEICAETSAKAPAILMIMKVQAGEVKLAYRDRRSRTGRMTPR